MQTQAVPEASPPKKRRRSRPKARSRESVARALDTLLEAPMMPATLCTNTPYRRRHDDNDGKRGFEHDLVVFLGQDNDAWVTAGEAVAALRFRVPFIGGGQSPRVRNALLVLAEAIRRDNEESPQA